MALPLSGFFGLLHQGNRMQRDDGGDGVFVDDLLLAVGAEHHGKAVKTGHGAPQLKAIHEEHGHGDILLAGLCEKDFL